MKRIICLVIGAVLIMVSYVYCRPDVSEIMFMVKTVVMSSLIFIVPLYLLFIFLSKKGILKELVEKTNNKIIYIPKFIIFLYYALVCLQMVTMIWVKSFEISSGAVLSAMIGVPCANGIKQLIKKESV